MKKQKKIRFVKIVAGILVSMFLLSACKSAKVAVNSDKAKRLPADAIIENHIENNLDFKTLRGRVKVGFDDGSSDQSHTLSIRIEKDKAIWMSATLSLAKIYITPERVSYYNKLQNEYFDGDFSYLSDLLGTDLDFEKVQNMLLGQSIFNLKEDRYRSDVVDNNYQLKPIKDFDLFKRLFLIEPTNYKMALQQISQPEEQRVLNIDYKTYQEIDDKTFPKSIIITAVDRDNKVQIDIDYKRVEFDQRVSFPYRIPKGYKEIELK